MILAFTIREIYCKTNFHAAIPVPPFWNKKYISWKRAKLDLWHWWLHVSPKECPFKCFNRIYELPLLLYNIYVLLIKKIFPFNSAKRKVTSIWPINVNVTQNTQIANYADACGPTKDWTHHPWLTNLWKYLTLTPQLNGCVLSSGNSKLVSLPAKVYLNLRHYLSLPKFLLRWIILLFGHVLSHSLLIKILFYHK